MNKLEDLRNYLVNRVPELKRNPDQILTFVDNGKITFYRGRSYSHKYQMPARVIVTDWRGNIDELVIAILEWVSVREPGSDPNETVTFDAQIVDSEAVDIAFTIQITDQVNVTWDGETRTIEHVLPNPPDSVGAETIQLFVNGPAYDFTLPDE